MLFKLIFSHVIFEPRYTMIANRTMSCRSIKVCAPPCNTGSTKNVPLTPLWCCSLKLKDTFLLGRRFSTQDVRRTRDSLRRETLKSLDTSERETLRQRLNAFARQSRKNSSIQRFEPCYRQIYPSKKRRATFTIQKKPPYIPAIYLKKTTSDRDKYYKTMLEPMKTRRLQWPPLYPSKRKDYPPTQPEKKNKELPQWLLPLYSCKTAHSEDLPSSQEARFSGGAFQRKMEIMESIKQIRANQDALCGRHLEKETEREESTILRTSKSSNAVETLKQKINTMQGYLSSVKNMDAYRKKYEWQKSNKENEQVTESIPVRQAYDRIYQTKLPTLSQEVKVRRSMGLGVGGPKPLKNPVLGTPSDIESVKGFGDNEEIRSSKNQHPEKTAEIPEGESNSAKETTARPSGTATVNNLSLGQFHKESVVMIRQPVWKTQRIPNSRTDEASSVKKMEESITTQIQASHEQQDKVKITAMKPTRSIKIQETRTVKGVKTPDPLTVESLKSRINVMKIKNTMDLPNTKKLDDISLTRNGGEVKPKISQVALRSFHQEAGSKLPKRTQVATNKLRLGYQRSINRRNFSTFSPPTRTHNKNTSKKPNWVSRLKRCFVLKKVKGSRSENWKEAPREIPYERDEIKFNSPAPILWKPSEMENNEGCNKTKPIGMGFKEKVNPAVLKAEQRVLASISRLISTKQDVIDVDIEKKIERAKCKVKVTPWLKRSKRNGTMHKLPEVRGAYNIEGDEPRESGYEWILKNKQMVEELKLQSRYAAGKSLVPTNVKNSINQYKLPLKAEISRYRKNMEQKCPERFFLYSTSKRWYSTSFAGSQRRILSCSDVTLMNTRGIKTESQRGNAITSKFLNRTQSDIVLRANQRKYNKRPIGHPINNEINEHEAEEKRPKKWTWKIPNKTRTFIPKTTTLTAPCRTSGARMSEMSPCALKKQVEELKCLIKKAREEVVKRTEEFPKDQSEDEYETRLRRLVKTAHSNAQKMQIAGPKYTSENNMMVNNVIGKRNSVQPMKQYTKVENSTPEVSVLKSLFKKTKGGSLSLANEILYRNNLTSLPALATSRKSDNSINRVYLKLKSMVEAVRKKSVTLDPTSNVKFLPSKSLNGTVSVDAASPLIGNNSEKIGKSDTTQLETSKGNAPQAPMVELQARKAPEPLNTIQLWKGEPKPQEFNSMNDKEPNYVDLVNLLSKAKGLFYYQPPEEDEASTKVTNSKTMGQNEMTSWLSLGDNGPIAATEVSKLDDNPQRVSEPSRKQSGVNLSEYMATKSKMIPFEFLKSEPKSTCNHMWANVPVKVLEDEVLRLKSSLDEKPAEINGQSTTNPCSQEFNNLPEKIKLWQPESQKDQEDSGLSHESTKLSVQKRMIALGSLAKSLGVASLFKGDESSTNTLGKAVNDEAKSSKYELNPSTSKTNHFEAEHSPQPQNAIQEFPSYQNSTNNHPDIEEVQHLIQSLGPVEGKVKEYENYYRNYFTVDHINGSHYLHQVYDGLVKLNNGQSGDNSSGRGMETREDTARTSSTPDSQLAQAVSIPDSKSPGLVEFQYGAQAKESEQETTPQALGTLGAADPGFGDLHPTLTSVVGGRQSEQQSTEVPYEQSTQAHNAERFVDSFHNILNETQDQVSDPSQLRPPISLESAPCESKDTQPNVEDLLAQDPTLNPEVVKNLKLPTILTEDCHTEKNWYTKLYSVSHRNH